MNVKQWKHHKGDCPTHVLHNIDPLVTLEPGTRLLVIAPEWFGRVLEWYGPGFAKHTIKYAAFFEHRKLTYLPSEEDRVKQVVQSVPAWNQRNIDLDPEKDSKIANWIDELQKLHKRYVKHITHAGELEITRRAAQCQLRQDTNNQPFTSVRALLHDCTQGTTRQRLFREDPNQFFALVNYLFFSLTNSEGDAWMRPAMSSFFEQEKLSMSNVDTSATGKHFAVTLAKWALRHHSEEFNKFFYVYQQTKLKLYKSAVPKNTYLVEIDIPMLGGTMNLDNLTVGTKRVFLEVSNLPKSPAFVNMMCSAARIARTVKSDGQPNLTRPQYMQIAAACYDDPELTSCARDVTALLYQPARNYEQPPMAPVPVNVPSVPAFSDVTNSNPVPTYSSLEHRALNSPGLQQQLNDPDTFFNDAADDINEVVDAAVSEANDGVVGSADVSNKDAAAATNKFDVDAVTEATCATAATTAVSSLTASVVEKCNTTVAAVEKPAKPPEPLQHPNRGFSPHPYGMVDPNVMMNMMHVFAQGILFCITNIDVVNVFLHLLIICYSGTYYHPGMPTNMPYNPYLGAGHPQSQVHYNSNAYPRYGNSLDIMLSCFIP